MLLSYLYFCLKFVFTLIKLLKRGEIFVILSKLCVVLIHIYIYREREREREREKEKEKERDNISCRNLRNISMRCIPVMGGGGGRGGS